MKIDFGGIARFLMKLPLMALRRLKADWAGIVLLNEMADRVRAGMPVRVMLEELARSGPRRHRKIFAAMLLEMPKPPKIVALAVMLFAVVPAWAASEVMVAAGKYDSSNGRLSFDKPVLTETLYHNAGSGSADAAPEVDGAGALHVHEIAAPSFVLGHWNECPDGYVCFKSVYADTVLHGGLVAESK